MTAAVVSAQLVGLDVRLPGLDALFDLGVVRSRFGDAWKTDVTDCGLLGARYEPGSDCVTTYEVETATATRTVGVMRLTPDGLQVRRYDDDAELAGLREAATPAAVAALLGHPGECRVEPVRYRPGERAVLRYELDLPAGPVVHFGKVVRSGVAGLAASFRHLHEQRTGGPRAPVPTAVVERLGLVVLPEVEGRSLHALVFDDSVPLDVRTHGCRAAGRAIAALHAGPGPAGIAPAPDDVLGLEGGARALLAIDPPLGDRWTAALAALAATDAGAVDLVPSHGALRTDQVIITAAGPTLLDLDGFCAARPARDIGNLVAYLRWRTMRRPGDGPAAAAARDAFLDGYREVLPLPAQRVLDRHEGLSMLKIAARRYRNLDATEWSLVPDLVRMATTLAGERGVMPVAHDDALSMDALVTPDVVTAALRRVLGPGAGGVRTVEVLEHKPGRRALLRYEIDGSGVVYGKAFPDTARAELTCALMGEVAGAVEPCGWAATRPLGLVPDLCLVLYQPLLGPSLDELVGTPGMHDGLAGAGRWLACLHGSALQLTRVLDIENEAANATTWSATAADAFPDLAAPSARLSAWLRDTVPAVIDAPVPIHKDFHYQHVIAGRRLGVVDVDEARMGDPMFDVGHFIANLALLADRRGATASELARWTAVFTDACGIELADESRLHWYEAYACVKLAKQLATGQGPRPRPEASARHVESARVLARGLDAVAP